METKSKFQIGDIVTFTKEACDQSFLNYVKYKEKLFIVTCIKEREEDCTLSIKEINSNNQESYSSYWLELFDGNIFEKYLDKNTVLLNNRIEELERCIAILIHSLNQLELRDTDILYGALQIGKKYLKKNNYGI